MGSEVNGILVAAHDLKAPLSVMRQLALSLDLAEDETTRTRLQAQLVNLSERALRQVNDLSKIARLEDGLFAMEPVSVRGVCDEVLRDASAFFALEHRRLDFQYKNRSRLAVANFDLLYSVIYNFCINAAHYSDSESTSVLSVVDLRGKIRIGVRDYGPSLPAKLWRALESGQLHQPTTIAMRPGSSGLGLYIASEFARYMHAKLGAIRHHDGSSFYIDLPISKQLSLWSI